MAHLQKQLTLLFLCWMLSIPLLAQFATYEFPSLSYEVIQQVDQGNFAEAKSLLQEWEVDDQESAAAAAYKFVEGYYHLLSTGGQESFTSFTDAGIIYDALGWERHRYLCEVHIVAALYIKTRWEEAKEKGISLLAEIPEDQQEARAILHNILGASYLGDETDYEKTWYHNQEAIAYFLPEKNYRRLTSIYGLLAASFRSQGNMQQAIMYIDSAQHFAKKINNESQIAFLNIRKFNALFDQKKHTEAFAVLDLAQQYFLEHPTEQGQLEWTYSLASRSHAALGNFEKAYAYRLKSDNLNPGARTKKNDAQINELMVAYETEKKENQIEIQLLTIENQQQQHRQLLISSIGGLCFLILLSAFGYFYFTNKQKEKLRQTQLEYQEQLLESTVNVQEAERKRISRDLHDGIGQQLSGLKIGFQQLHEQISRLAPDQNTQLQKLDAILNDASTDVRNLSHQMMPKALQELGLVAALGDLLEKSLPPAKLKYQFEHTGLKERLPENIEIGLYRIAQELINNILKHAEAQEVDVQLLRRNNQLLLIVEDDGKGFVPGAVQNDGHGLTNIRSRLQAIKGEVHFDGLEKGGTVVNVRVEV